MISVRFESLSHALHRLVAPSYSRLAASSLLAIGLFTSPALAEVTAAEQNKARTLRTDVAGDDRPANA
jgi:hypothetical protein